MAVPKGRGDFLPLFRAMPHGGCVISAIGLVSTTNSIDVGVGKWFFRPLST